jgi:uncharacterized membrane protein YeiH
MSWIYFLDLFGTGVFAISGVLTAIEKRFDILGTLVIGFVTAIGGGTIRDILIGRFPVGWLTDRSYFIVIFVAYVFAYSLQSVVIKFRRSLFVFDTIGIGLFTILGIQISLSYNLNIENCLTLGVVSACFGGVIRDVLTNEIPLIFRREIYATACFIGGVLYLILRHLQLQDDVSIILSIIAVILIRYFAIKKSWSLNFHDK